MSFIGLAKTALLDLDRPVQRFVPDLAIEVASASDTYEGLLAKKERYLQAGTSEVWLFSLRTRELAIYTVGRSVTLRGGDEIATDLVPGFSITVDQLLEVCNARLRQGSPECHAAGRTYQRQRLSGIPIGVTESSPARD